MLEELTQFSATTLARLIANHQISPVEVVEAFLRRSEQFNQQLNAIVTFAPDALAQARLAEQGQMRGTLSGPLHGVPLTIKDTIDTARLRSTSGSLLRADYVPAHDASSVARLRASGAIILGKTNVSEMAVNHTATDNPLFGRTINPRDPLLSAGGSSGGEAAAIAARLSPAGVGSDLTGSIRIPAHFCGIYGLKPTTPGHVPQDGQCPPNTGAFALGATLGPLARSVDDLALLYSVLSGEKLETEIDCRNLRAAFYTHDGVTGVSAETRRAIHFAAEILGESGLNVREERPPGVEHGTRLWFALFADQAASFLQQTYAGREQLAGALVQTIIARQRGQNDYPAALTEREHWRRLLLDWMRETPLLIAPVGATSAFPHDQRTVMVDHQELSIFRAFSFVQAYNVFGLPVACVPVRRSVNEMPIGVQIVGPPFGEALVLAAARLIERACS